jgi:phosphoglycerol transferase MdoB-like AlkP superfamily enzyme
VICGAVASVAKVSLCAAKDYFCRKFLKSKGLKQNAVPLNVRALAGTGLLLLVVLSLLRVGFLLAFDPPAGSEPIPYVSTLWLGLRFDARAVSVACLFLLLSGFIPALNPYKSSFGRKLHMVLWFILLLSAGIFYAVDFANYAYLKERLNGGLLNYVADTGTSIRMIWETYPVVTILISITVAMLVLMQLIRIIYRRSSRTQFQYAKRSTIGISAGFVLLLAFLIFGRIGQYPLRWSDAFTLGHDFASNAALNPFQSFFSSLKFRKSTFDKEKVQAAYPLMVQYLGIDKPDPVNLNFTRRVRVAERPEKPCNVVLVICESFSAYKTSAYGNKLNTTPFFDSLCGQGVFFDRCFTPSYGTARGVWTTITGIPDVDQTRTSSRNPNAVNQHTIINDFEGYDRFYFIGGSLSWANIRGMLTNNIQGLQIYEQDDFEAEKIDVWGISDKNLFLEANKILARQTKPFFSVIQTADNHRPYTIPEEDRKEFEIKQLPTDSLERNGFQSVEEYNAFRYTDFCYRKFMEAASKEAYFNNTLFVFIGDHGIGGDAGNLFPLAWKELTSQHVPLLFYAPGFLQPARYHFNVSQTDVLPTIAGLCKISYKNTTLGRDLLSPFVQQQPLLQSAFIYNPDSRRIGIVKDDLFFSYGVEGNLKEQFYSTKHNQPPAITDSLRAVYYDLTEAWYQTARYMLLNNKAR